MALQTSKPASVPEDVPHRVLIIDDALTVRMYYRQILERAGFEVVEAGNGLEGLEKAAEAIPELMLVDVNMPKMDGYTMLRAVRADEGLRAIPAVMISTEAEARDGEKAYAAGANVYLIKPVRPDDLLALTRMMLGLAVS